METFLKKFILHCRETCSANCSSANMPETKPHQESIFLPTQVDILNTHRNVFSGLGKFTGIHHIQIDSRVNPVVEASRRKPIALYHQVKEELDRIQQLGVNTLVSKPTDWVSSMVTVVKPG